MQYQVPYFITRQNAQHAPDCKLTVKPSKTCSAIPHNAVANPHMQMPANMHPDTVTQMPQTLPWRQSTPQFKGSPVLLSQPVLVPPVNRSYHRTPCCCGHLPDKHTLFVIANPQAVVPKHCAQPCVQQGSKQHTVSGRLCSANAHGMCQTIPPVPHAHHNSVHSYCCQ